MMCCTGSLVYFAGWHFEEVLKSGLEVFAHQITVVLVILQHGSKSVSIKRKAEIKLCFFGFLWSDYCAFLTNLCCSYSHANCPHIGLIAFRLRSTLQRSLKPLYIWRTDTVKWQMHKKISGLNSFQCWSGAATCLFEGFLSSHFFCLQIIYFSYVLLDCTYLFQINISYGLLQQRQLPTLSIVTLSKVIMFLLNLPFFRYLHLERCVIRQIFCFPRVFFL